MTSTFKIILMTLITSTFLSCATTHPGHVGASTDSSKLPLKLSARVVEQKRDGLFELIEFTLENTSEEWLKITNSKILISNPEVSKLSVVLGDDLIAWAEATQLQKNQDDYNDSLIKTGLMGLGTAAMIAGGSSDARVSGAALVIGTYAWAAGDVLSGKYQTANGVLTKPKSHLYEPTSVPGKMFLRRWALINKPSGVYIQSIAVQFEDIHGVKGTYNVNL